jgi:hypothetical protein
MGSQNLQAEILVCRTGSKFKYWNSRFKESYWVLYWNACTYFTWWLHVSFFIWFKKLKLHIGIIPPKRFLSKGWPLHWFQTSCVENFIIDKVESPIPISNLLLTSKIFNIQIEQHEHPNMRNMDHIHNIVETYIDNC